MNVVRAGDPNSNISRVGVLVNKLAANPALHGFMGTIDWAGNLIVGNVHRRDRMQSWLTHFALVVEFGQGGNGLGELWLLERNDGGVVFRPFDAGEFGNNFRWIRGHRCGDSKVLCTIYSADNPAVTRAAVWGFLDEQMRFGYNGIHKNCKHFAYDFYHFCLRDDWARNVNFPTFTETIEANWVEHRGW